MLRITGGKILEPEEFTSDIGKSIRNEITAIKKEYGNKGLYVETIGFRTRGDGQVYALIKFSYIATDYRHPPPLKEN